MMLAWARMPCCLVSGACSERSVLHLLLESRQVSLAQPFGVLTQALVPSRTWQRGKWLLKIEQQVVTVPYGIRQVYAAVEDYR